MNDTASFGSFVNSFLTAFRDEFVKLPCLAIPLLSDAGSRHIDVDDVSYSLTLMNMWLQGYFSIKAHGNLSVTRIICVVSTNFHP